MKTINIILFLILLSGSLESIAQIPPPPCSLNQIVLSNQTISGTNNYIAINSVVSDNTSIQNNADVLFQGGARVTLSPNFRVEAGAVFTAQILTCNSNISTDIDLEIDVTTDGDVNIPLGSHFNLFVTVTNTSGNPATGVQIGNIFDPNISYIQHGLVANTGTFDPNTGIWNLGNLAAGASADLYLIVEAIALGSSTHLAQVIAANQNDVDSTPNNMGASPSEDDEGAFSVTLVNKRNIGEALSPNSKAINDLSCYPNPASDQTQIVFSLSEASIIDLKIYDLTGKQVATLLGNTPYSKGKHQVFFDTSDLPNGAYIYTLQTDNSKQSKQLIINR